MSVLEVFRREDNSIHVRGVDMLDGAPILGINPFVKGKYSCPSYREWQER